MAVAFLVGCSSEPSGPDPGGPAGGSSSNAAGTAGASSTAGAAAGGALASGGAAGSTALAGSAGAALGGSDNAASGAGGAGGAAATIVLHIAGDSTAAVFPPSDPRVGWGAVFQERFSGRVTVDDRALSGRSTKSYIDEGAWTTLIATVKAGDYVFIQFGHNDEKSEDATRYTDPATTFRDNLRRFVTETRAAGGEPLLLTPISRSKFSGSMVTASHGAYPDAVKAVATETSTSLIDMTEKTRIWLESLGPTAAVPFFAPDDQTHTSLAGAQEVSKLVAAGLIEQSHPLAALLK